MTDLMVAYHFHPESDRFPQGKTTQIEHILLIIVINAVNQMLHNCQLWSKVNLIRTDAVSLFRATNPIHLILSIFGLSEIAFFLMLDSMLQVELIFPAFNKNTLFLLHSINYDAIYALSIVLCSIIF